MLTCLEQMLLISQHSMPVARSAAHSSPERQKYLFEVDLRFEAGTGSHTIPLALSF